MTGREMINYRIDLLKTVQDALARDAGAAQKRVDLLREQIRESIRTMEVLCWVEPEEAQHMVALNRLVAERTALTDEEWQDWKATRSGRIGRQLRGASRPSEQPASIQTEGMR